MFYFNVFTGCLEYWPTDDPQQDYELVNEIACDRAFEASREDRAGFNDWNGWSND